MRYVSISYWIYSLAPSISSSKCLANKFILQSLSCKRHVNEREDTVEGEAHDGGRAIGTVEHWASLIGTDDL